LDISTTLLLLHTVCAKSLSEQYIELLEAGRTTYRTALTHVLIIVYFWAIITSNGSPDATVPLSCLSVMLVYCGQTVGWIKLPLVTEVGVGPGDTVLDGDPAPPRKGAQQPPSLGPCLLWPNGRPSQQGRSDEGVYRYIYPPKISP